MSLVDDKYSWIYTDNDFISNFLGRIFYRKAQLLRTYIAVKATEYRIQRNKIHFPNGISARSLWTSITNSDVYFTALISPHFLDGHITFNISAVFLYLDNKLRRSCCGRLIMITIPIIILLWVKFYCLHWSPLVYTTYSHSHLSVARTQYNYYLLGHTRSRSIIIICISFDSHNFSICDGFSFYYSSTHSLTLSVFRNNIILIATYTLITTRRSRIKNKVTRSI